MRRPVIFVPLALVSALLVSGCGGGSTAAEPAPPPPPTTQPTPPPPTKPPPPPAPSKPSPTFTKDDLPRIALGPKNAPPDLVYLKEESGPMTAEQARILLPHLSDQLHSLGFQVLQDAVFGSKATGSDRRVTERIWLFRKRTAAKSWLKKTHDDSVAFQFAPIGAPPLGDESFAVQGLLQAAEGEALTHAFRLGNAVVVVSMYGNVTLPSQAAALAAAKAALAKARRG
jgi:hypothetical protein